MLKKLSLEGKVAIVTGGGTGLGREMVRQLAQAGADLVIAARRPGPIQEAAQEVVDMGRKAIAIPCDVTNPSQVNSMVAQALERFGKVDVLVNNAGMVREQRLAPIWEITDDEWRLGIDTNLSSAFYCIRAVAKSMAERGKGKIINVSSGYGLRGGRDNYMYCAGKGGVIQLTRAVAISLGRHGITCTCIVPGAFDTEATTAIHEVMPRNQFIPVGRMGSPREIGPVAVFLASEASDYINGEMFVTDGGGLAGGYAPTGYAPVHPLPKG